MKRDKCFCCLKSSKHPKFPGRELNQGHYLSYNSFLGHCLIICFWLRPLLSVLISTFQFVFSRKSSFRFCLNSGAFYSERQETRDGFTVGCSSSHFPNSYNNAYIVEEKRNGMFILGSVIAQVLVGPSKQTE